MSEADDIQGDLHPIFYAPGSGHDSYPRLEDGEVLTPVVQACVELATEAHEFKNDTGEPHYRKKPDFDMPYIHHPIAAMNLLRLMGVSDEITLGAALLHDTLEDDKFRRDPEALKAALLERFAHHEVQEAEETADAIIDIVQEVTNPEIVTESKRLFQSDKLAKLSRRAQQVKLADVGSSLVDDAMHGNNMKLEKAVQFVKRGTALSMIAEKALPRLAKLNALLSVVIQDKVMQGDLRRFDALQDVKTWPALLYVVDKMPEMGLLSYKPFKRWFHDTANDKPKFRIDGVGLDEFARVTTFDITAPILQPTGDKSETMQFLTALEERTDNYAVIDEARIQNGETIRRVHLDSAVPVAKFLESQQTGVTAVKLPLRVVSIPLKQTLEQQAKGAPEPPKKKSLSPEQFLRQVEKTQARVRKKTRQLIAKHFDMSVKKTPRDLDVEMMEPGFDEDGTPVNRVTITTKDRAFVERLEREFPDKVFNID